MYNFSGTYILICVTCHFDTWSTTADQINKDSTEFMPDEQDRRFEELSNFWTLT